MKIEHFESLFSVAEMNASTYFKAPFHTLVLPKQLTEYTVMNIEPIADHERHKFAGQGALSKKVMLYLRAHLICCHAIE